MINSFMTAIPFAPFISFGVSMLNQFSSSTNTESLEILFEDVVFEKKMLRNVRLIVNNKDSLDILVNTEFNLDKIIVEIDPAIQVDIKKFMRYIKSIDHISLNKYLKAFQKEGYDIDTIVIRIKKNNDKYRIEYIAPSFRKDGDIIDKPITLAVVDVSTETFKESGVIIGDRNIDNQVSITKLSDPEYRQKALKEFKELNRDIIKYLNESAKVVRNMKEIIEREAKEKMNEKIKEELILTVNRLNRLETSLKELSDKVTNLSIALTTSNIDINQTIFLLKMDIDNLNRDIAKLDKEIEKSKEYFRESNKEMIDRMYSYVDDMLEALNKKIEAYKNSIGISRAMKNTLRPFLELFLKPLMFISRSFKTLISKLFKRGKEQNKEQNKTEAKLIASLIARFEYYSIVYENNVIGQISSIITKVIQFIKNAIKGSYNAVKDFIRWFAVNSAKILSILISATVNVLQKSNNILRDFVNRYNKT